MIDSGNSANFNAARGGDATSRATGGDSASFSGAGAVSSNEGNALTAEGSNLSTSYNSDYDSRAYALALPGLTAAPAVATECLRHTRGMGGLSIGVTGGTKFDEDCLENVKCIAIADRYAAWGQVALAVEQLATCGGVGATEIAPTDLSEYATKEELHRVFEATLTK